MLTCAAGAQFILLVAVDDRDLCSDCNHTCVTRPLLDTRAAQRHHPRSLSIALLQLFCVSFPLPLAKPTAGDLFVRSIICRNLKRRTPSVDFSVAEQLSIAVGKRPHSS
jgi:hypothetical protein